MYLLIYIFIRLTMQQYLELNRRFADGFSKISDEPKVVKLLQEVRRYNEDLDKLYLTDRQVNNFLLIKFFTYILFS